MKTVHQIIILLMLLPMLVDQIFLVHDKKHISLKINKISINKILIFDTLNNYFQIIFLTKNTNVGYKDTSLIWVLQGYFKGELNLARSRLIYLFITALCKTKIINYDRLACAFDSKVDKNSSYRRIASPVRYRSGQRFMKDFDFSMKVVSVVILNILPFKENLVLILDRTN
jgi:hypothetical protein